MLSWPETIGEPSGKTKDFFPGKDFANEKTMDSMFTIASPTSFSPLQERSPPLPVQGTCTCLAMVADPKLQLSPDPK